VTAAAAAKDGPSSGDPPVGTGGFKGNDRRSLTTVDTSTVQLVDGRTFHVELQDDLFSLAMLHAVAIPAVQWLYQKYLGLIVATYSSVGSLHIELDTKHMPYTLKKFALLQYTPG